MRVRPEGRFGGVVLLLALLLSACQVNVTVGIDAGDDGRGTVRAEVLLDREAAGRIKDLGRELRTDDLTEAGWVVAPPKTNPNGSVVMVATKRFARPEQVDEVVGQLSGKDGPFQGFRLEQRRTFFRTTTRLRGEVDLTAGLDGFGDAGLEAATGSKSGVDQAAIEEQLGRALDQIVSIAVAARLPGEVESNATGATAVWRPKLGERITITADATRTNWPGIVATALAITAVLGAAALVITRRRRRA